MLMLERISFKHLLLLGVYLLLVSCAMPTRSGYDRNKGDWPDRRFTLDEAKRQKSSSTPKIYTPKIQGNLRKVTDTWIGTPYAFGAQTKGEGTDCSGLVHEVYKEYLGIEVPRHSQTLYVQGKEVSESDLKPGDLLFFGPGSYIDHTAIYMGDGIFCHASTSQGVEYRNRTDAYWAPRYKGARRFVP